VALYTNIYIFFKVLEMPEDADVLEGQVMSSTPFYTINATKAPKKSLTVDVRASSVSSFLKDFPKTKPQYFHCII